jgi:hypothetical protein
MIPRDEIVRRLREIRGGLSAASWAETKEQFKSLLRDLEAEEPKGCPTCAEREDAAVEHKIDQLTKQNNINWSAGYKAGCGTQLDTIRSRVEALQRWDWCLDDDCYKRDSEGLCLMRDDVLAALEGKE